MAQAKITQGNYTTEVELESFRIIADEPESLGGLNLGPKPTEILDAALASCTIITLKMYAARKQWDLGNIEVEVKRVPKADGSAKFIILLRSDANFGTEQKDRLLYIAGRCPVHKLLNQNEMMVDWAVE